MEFKAQIKGGTIVCELSVDRAVSDPVFCFSCMAPMKVLEGGTKVRGVGGYTEVSLPSLSPGNAHKVIIAHEVEEFVPANRAWLPLGAYLRTSEGVFTLPPLPAGVHPRNVKETPSDDLDLRLCPQPTRFEASGATVGLDALQLDPNKIPSLNAWCQRMGQPDLLAAEGLPLSLKSDPSLAPEAYRLSIGSDGCTIETSGPAGLFYAGITLASLRRNHGGVIPCGVIEDSPRFEWRGQHLDCARHFYEVDFILRLLDVMAMLKLNRFHWHFADDEAFRLELESLPELNRTHFRGEGELMPGVFGGGARSGGSYSKADVRRVVEHAGALGIEVMPEIEVPAHALALAELYPASRDPEDKGKEVSVQGYAKNVMNPAMPESWRVWESAAREVAELFPFGVVHLGGDELPDETWMHSPAARALMKAEGLNTTHDLLGWTLNRLAEKLPTYGARPAAWEEASFGSVGIQNDAILFSWSSQGPGLEAARAGYAVVMTPGQHAYFDMAHTSDTDDWGANWAAIIGLDDTVNWEPVPDAEPELEKQILGVQGAFWGEFTTQDHEAEPMIAPRILGLAMMGWQPRGSADKAHLRALACSYRDLLDEAGWQSN